MNFFNTIKNSIYSPEFYREIPKRSFGKALGYYALLSLFIAVITTVSLFPFISKLRIDGETFVKTSFNKYPKDLEVKIKNGKVSTNVQEPYILKFAEESESKAGNSIVIDTKTPFSAGQFNKYHAIAWIGQDAIFMRASSSRSEIKTYDLSQVKDFTLNRSVLSGLVQKITPYFAFFVPVAIIFMLVVLLFVQAFNLLLLLISALLVLLVAKYLASFPITYSEAYKVTLHAITLGAIINLVLSLLNQFAKIGFTGFPLMGTLILLIVVFVNLRGQTVSATPTKSKTPKST